MTKEQIKANFKSAHSTQLQKVADAQFNQMEAAAILAKERATLRELEKQFRLDMATPDGDGQMELPLDAKAKSK